MKDGLTDKTPEMYKDYDIWNVERPRTIHKKREVFSEINRMKVEVMVRSETKIKGSDEEQYAGLTHLWSGVDKSVRAKRGVGLVVNKRKVKILDWTPVSEGIITAKIRRGAVSFMIIAMYAPTEDSVESEKDEFFEKVLEITTGVNSNDELIILGDLNERVVSKTNNSVTDRYADTVQNDNGTRIEMLSQTLECQLLNTVFPHKEHHRYTWRSHTGDYQSILDYIIMRKNRQCVVEDC